MELVQWLPSKSSPASIVLFIRKGFDLPFCPLALSRKGHVTLKTNWSLLSQKDRVSALWNTRLWVEEPHPVFVQDTASRLVVSCRQPLPCHIPPRRSAASLNLRLLPKVSLHRGPSIVSSCEIPGHLETPWRPSSVLSQTLP